MRKTLIALFVTVLAIAGAAACSEVKTATVAPPATMKTYYTVGSCTPEAILLEADWL